MILTRYLCFRTCCDEVIIRTLVRMQSQPWSRVFHFSFRRTPIWINLTRTACPRHGCFFFFLVFKRNDGGTSQIGATGGSTNQSLRRQRDGGRRWPWDCRRVEEGMTRHLVRYATLLSLLWNHSNPVSSRCTLNTALGRRRVRFGNLGERRTDGREEGTRGTGENGADHRRPWFRCLSLMKLSISQRLFIRRCRSKLAEPQRPGYWWFYGNG